MQLKGDWHQEVFIPSSCFHKWWDDTSTWQMWTKDWL